jgi:hypothetical protein
MRMNQGHQEIYEVVEYLLVWRLLQSSRTVRQFGGGFVESQSQVSGSRAISQ